MNLLDQLATNSGQDAPAELTCSRKACKNIAAWQLLWNNPKIHTPDRRKIWLACGEHRNWLQDYLSSRELWKETLPIHGKDSDT